jgi:hypothetical protein
LIQGQKGDQTLGLPSKLKGELFAMQTELDMNGSPVSPVAISPGSRMRAALALAIVADLLQIAVFPLFVEGAASPADDLLDLGMAGAMSFLLGWHWEFLPSFFAKLVPGVDFVPLWTLAVANVYRKSKRSEVNPGKIVEGQASGKDARQS